MECNQLKCVSQDYFYKLGIYVVRVGNHKKRFSNDPHPCIDELDVTEKPTTPHEK
jgi:hypothetical protein